MKKIEKILMATAVVGSLLVAVPAFAQGMGGWGRQGEMRQQGMGGMIRPGMGVAGLVSSLNGNTIMVDSARRGMATTTYAVDASNATIFKNNATSTVSSILTGDRVIVSGTINGTNVTAKVIRDGLGRIGQGFGMGGRGGKDGKRGVPSGNQGAMGGAVGGAMQNLQGNGQPVVGGNVTSVNGSTFSITNASNATFSIDATNANIVKSGATSTASNIQVGDSVMVQGTINGSSVTANTVIDKGQTFAPSGNTTPRKGFFGGISNFVHKIFGFF